MSRIAIIQKEKCKPNLCELECIKHCPVNMTEVECLYIDKKIQKAYIDEILCTGCGICPKVCPFGAIEIINLPEIKNKAPIHQYGLNGFRIFSLPLIQKNAITSIMGRNGIGKTTVINILSNTMQANFSNILTKIDSKKYFETLNKMFKGTALQNYFNELKNDKIKISYKPQQIVNLPKIYSGKVEELLTKITKDKNLIEDMTKKLNINQILNRDIKFLSGGELQKVAICASLLKTDSNFFIFDEITNYLDIFERLNTSFQIKQITKNKTTLVVEHDLVILDYLSDYIHIMYGQVGAYGILTGIQNAKVGINTYLSGFSKEQNIRFRDKPISFDKGSAGESKKIEILTSWEKSKIINHDFTLDINSGNIKKGEIIGIIGKNALGKTTFVKYIRDSHNKDMLEVSYKPQLIPTSDFTVQEILMKYKNYTDTFHQIYVLDPLNIKALIEKKISTLSGGELQRFAIANCLLKESDLYLIDESTAFLDVEDRLKISKIIKNFISTKEKSALIIDHDLIFLDYLSDKLIVFQGKPSIEGIVLEPKSLRDGMNIFLSNLKLTFRRDEENKRPRINKLNSVKDVNQKKIGEYYYV